MCYKKTGELVFLNLYVSFICEGWQQRPVAGGALHPLLILSPLTLPRPDPVSTNNRLAYGTDSKEQLSDKVLSDDDLSVGPALNY